MIRVDYATCFTSHELKTFCDSNNVKINFCTVGDLRFNGLANKTISSHNEKKL